MLCHGTSQEALLCSSKVNINISHTMTAPTAQKDLKCAQGDHANSFEPTGFTIACKLQVAV